MPYPAGAWRRARLPASATLKLVFRGTVLLLASALAIGCAEPGPAAVGAPAPPPRPAPYPARTTAPPPRPAPPPMIGNQPREEPRPPRPAEEMLSTEHAASPAAARVVDQILALRRQVRASRYQHVTEIRPADGFYGWDCSGMASWILRRAAARAFRALRRPRAAAIDFFRLIDAIPPGERRRGWQKLAHVSHARPGDVFAFARSPLSTSPVTGHIGFLVEQPREVDGMPGVYQVRILDSTSYPHQHDSRGETATGFGFGTMVFVTDERGEAIAYGWYGTQSAGFMPTRILFARVW